MGIVSWAAWLLTPSVGDADKHQLTEDQVHRIVSDYESTAITERLDDLGRVMLAANRERARDLERKATLIVAYCLGVLAFLVSREPVQSVVVQPWPPFGLRAASVCAALSLIFAFMALRVRSYPWLSDQQWFEHEQDAMDDADTLRRCHVLALHGVNSRLRAFNDEKADHVVVAQALLVGAGLFLAAWVFVR